MRASERTDERPDSAVQGRYLHDESAILSDCRAPRNARTQAGGTATDVATVSLRPRLMPPRTSIRHANSSATALAPKLAWPESSTSRQTDAWPDRSGLWGRHCLPTAGISPLPNDAGGSLF